MAIQFVKNQSFTLRSVSLYDSRQQFRTEDGAIVHKAGEPTMKGIVYPDQIEVLAIEKFAGGGFLCQFPNGELAYVDSNKIWENHISEDGYKAKQAAKAAVKVTGNGTVNGATKKVAMTPIERVRALKAEKVAIEARFASIDNELAEALKALQTAKAEQDAMLMDLEAELSQASA
jgi:hypothetical protein